MPNCLISGDWADNYWGLEGSQETEWARLARSSDLNKRLRDWEVSSGGVVAAADANELVSIVRGRRADCDGRAASRWLLEHARKDQLAGRVLVQAMEPSVVRQWCGRLRANLAYMSEPDWSACCLSAVWLAIAQHGGADRPWPMWSLRQTFMRELLSMEQIASSSGFAMMVDPEALVCDDDPVEPAIELSRLLRDAVADRFITRDEASLVWRSRIAGFSIASVAAEEGVSPVAIRKRRERAERRLRQRMAA